MKFKKINMNFEWNENKNNTNKEKHKIDFEFASRIFTDKNRIEWEDKRKDYGECRFITIGKIMSTAITVVYTLREETIRIISARPSKRGERDLYNS